ncbi:MAG: Hsp20/alpha crystallin family protein [Nitrospirota bacterium]|nr:MAG: Hsp20/alpha crystallin family protein [Nitrospirota bacterium]
MAVVRWTPFRELSSIRRDMQRLMGDLMEPIQSRELLGWPKNDGETGIVPNLELINKKDKLIVRAELPGIEKEDVELSITDDTLTIKGEVRKSEEIKEDDYYLSEISYGKFSRTITVPAEVDGGKAKASMKNGVLEIVFPRTKESKPKEIKVDIS